MWPKWIAAILQIVMISLPPNQSLVVFSIFWYFATVAEHTLVHLQLYFLHSPAAVRRCFPTPQWLSLLTQLPCSDRSAGGLTPAAQRTPRDSWLSSDHSTCHLWLCASVCLETCARSCICVTAGLNSGWSNCHSLYFAHGTVKLSLSLEPSYYHRTHMFCPFGCNEVSIIISNNGGMLPFNKIHQTPVCLHFNSKWIKT